MRHFFVSRAAVLAVGLAIVGCGDDEEGSGGSGGTAGAGASAGASGTAGSSGTAGTAGTSGSSGSAGAGGSAGGGPLPPEGTYNFESQFNAGESSVAYSGQIWRHVAIADLKTFIGGMTADIDGANPLGLSDKQSVLDALNFYFRFKTLGDGTVAHLVSTMPAAQQTTYDDISTDKDLVGKIAGNDTTTDHKNWSTMFVGWSDTSINGGSPIATPEALIDAYFGLIADNAVDRLNNVPRYIPGEPMMPANELPVHVTADGLDLQQLVQKVLLGAVAYSQGTDDYLDDDVADKGLMSSNAQDGTNAYTTLEHHWDEGFGYFGAARNYDEYDDDELSSKGGRMDWQGYHDTNGDGFLDLKSEHNFGHSVNAAKRDRGSAATAATDFTKQAFDALVAGRNIISGASDPLTAQEMTDLQAQRDLIVDAWERAIAATIVHYINEVLRDMGRFGDPSYSYLDHAKHWGELKGFALGLQFNPRSQVSDTDFAAFHTHVGDRPVLSEAAGATAQQITDYRAALISARDILKASYLFDDANMGDANGENGW